MAEQIHKGDLVERVHLDVESDISKADIAKVVNALIDNIGELLVETDAHVVLQNLGTFKTHKQASKMGRDFDGITIEIPEHKRLTFAASRGLKDRLKGK